MSSFVENNRKKPNNGKTGEKLAMQYLQGQGWDVLDVSGNSDFWGKDIDLVCHKDNKTMTVEVKWDGRIADTGNLFIETVTDLDNQKQGWFQFCQADYIYYGDKWNRLFYAFRTEDLQNFIADNTLEQRKAADYSYNGNVRKVSQGYIVPIRKFSQSYQVQIIHTNR